MSKKFSPSLFLWDLWCTVSIVGIWPRFIEPKLLITTKLKLPVKDLPSDLEGLKIVQFSDLHMNPNVTDNFLNRLSKKINRLKPDVIVFCGDLINHGKVRQPDRIKKFLNTLHASYGCFAVYGNHDYAGCITINNQGDYDLWQGSNSQISEGFKRVFGPKIVLSKKVTDAAKAIPEHLELRQLWSESPFTLLHNETRLIPIKGSHLNVTGLGEYILGKCQPEKAFADYDSRYPTLVLAHNPDSISILKDYPGDVILSGHTHGGQINLPWIWRKLTLMENPDLKKGLFNIKNHWLYVNRGIGESMPFRWFAYPEILSLTLEKHDK